jgi:hypothetical protein
MRFLLIILVLIGIGISFVDAKLKGSLRGLHQQQNLVGGRYHLFDENLSDTGIDLEFPSSENVLFHRQIEECPAMGEAMENGAIVRSITQLNYGFCWGLGVYECKCDLGKGRCCAYTRSK